MINKLIIPENTVPFLFFFYYTVPNILSFASNIFRTFTQLEILLEVR